MLTVHEIHLIRNNEVEIYPFRDSRKDKWGYQLSTKIGNKNLPVYTCSAMYDGEGDARTNAKDLIAKARDDEFSWT
ncbi:MAG: hypothetical protein IH845_03940 [Nanoarchaeota archaeon]|nr:hypothetical protein [Nanoarchaeota archaeon]